MFQQQSVSTDVSTSCHGQSSDLGHGLDPKAPLSTKDLAKLLIEYCDKKVYKPLREDLSYERSVTNDQIKLVIKGFNEGLVSI